MVDSAGVLCIGSNSDLIGLIDYLYRERAERGEDQWYWNQKESGWDAREVKKDDGGGSGPP